MDIVVTGRNAEIHPNFRQAVEDKLEKVTLFYPRAQRVEVVLTHESNPRLADRSERIELTVYGKGPVIRAEAESSDRYSAVDLASAKLFERLRRMRDRVKDRRKGKGSTTPEPSELAPEIIDDRLTEDFTDAEDWALRSAGDLKRLMRRHRCQWMTRCNRWSWWDTRSSCSLTKTQCNRALPTTGRDGLTASSV